MKHKRYKKGIRKPYHRADGVQTWDDLENVVDSMQLSEQVALGLGFYNMDDFYQNEIDLMNDFDGDEDFDEFTDYVDDDYFYQEFSDDEDDEFDDEDFDNVITDGDDWIGMGDEDFLNAHHSKKKMRGGGRNAFSLKGSHHINFNEDGEVGLEGGDDEFDNLLSKKGRKRRKLRRKKRKELKKSGMSRKEARKKARKEARAEIPRDTLKETAKKSWKKIKKVGKGAWNIVKKASLSVSS